MAPRRICKHERARFHSIQRLGNQPPVELWHCPSCNSTIAVETVRRASARGFRPRTRSRAVAV